MMQTVEVSWSMAGAGLGGLVAGLLVVLVAILSATSNTSDARATFASCGNPIGIILASSTLLGVGLALSMGVCGVSNEALVALVTNDSIFSWLLVGLAGATTGGGAFTAVRLAIVGTVPLSEDVPSRRERLSSLRTGLLAEIRRAALVARSSREKRIRDNARVLAFSAIDAGRVTYEELAGHVSRFLEIGSLRSSRARAYLADYHDVFTGRLGKNHAKVLVGLLITDGDCDVVLALCEEELKDGPSSVPSA